MERTKRETSVALKPTFVEYYKELLGADYELFSQELDYYLPKAVRLNTLKAKASLTKERLSHFFSLEQIPWCAEGFWLQGERRDVGNTIEHQLGYCYIQEAASMLPPVVLKAQPGDVVLDIAASPGSKTTQLAAMMQNKGVILANDQGMRLRPLGINIQKCGCTNVLVTNMDGRSIKNNRFDKALADVPCSATGTIQRSLAASRMWNPRTLPKLQQLQFQLARNAYEQLKAGGTMVYSTCTLEPTENEGVVTQLVGLGAKTLPIDLPMKREKPFTSWHTAQFDSSVKHCLRIHPYTNHTEGFFVCLLQKPT